MKNIIVFVSCRFVVFLGPTIAPSHPSFSPSLETQICWCDVWTFGQLYAHVMRHAEQLKRTHPRTRATHPPRTHAGFIAAVQQDFSESSMTNNTVRDQLDSLNLPGNSPCEHHPRSAVCRLWSLRSFWAQVFSCRRESQKIRN